MVFKFNTTGIFLFGHSPIYMHLFDYLRDKERMSFEMVIL